jgi:hypothetical protein
MKRKRNDLFERKGIRNALLKAIKCRAAPPGVLHGILLLLAKRLYNYSVDVVSVGDVSSVEVFSSGLSIVDSFDGGAK